MTATEPTTLPPALLEDAVDAARDALIARTGMDAGSPEETHAAAYRLARIAVEAASAVLAGSGEREWTVAGGGSALTGSGAPRPSPSERAADLARAVIWRALLDPGDYAPCPADMTDDDCWRREAVVAALAAAGQLATTAQAVPAHSPDRLRAAEEAATHALAAHQPTSPKGTAQVAVHAALPFLAEAERIAEWLTAQREQGATVPPWITDALRERPGPWWWDHA